MTLTFEQSLTGIYDQCHSFDEEQISVGRAANDLRRAFAGTMKTCVGGTRVVAHAFSVAEEAGNNFRSRLPHPFNQAPLQATGVKFGQDAMVRGFFISAFALIELTLRGLVLDASGDRKEKFVEIRRFVCNDTRMDAGVQAGLARIDDLLVLLALYRNTIHNNGHHSKASTTVTWRSTVYRFDKDQEPSPNLDAATAALLVGDAVQGTLAAFQNWNKHFVDWPVDVVLA